MFLMIENDGVAHVQAFTVMGLSTARGNADKIGQFGTGNKHGILTCMRQEIKPSIFLGENELKFATTTDKMGDKEYKHLIYEFKGEIKELPIALECGALDWNGLDMGLREFVSNAIDAGGERVEVVSQIEPHSRKTRIFLPFRPEVAKFYSELPEKFLHFSKEFKQSQTIMQKEKLSPAKCYRKGVFVRESRDNSLFNYNFGDDIKIDECRNMDAYTIRNHAANLWMKAGVEQIRELFTKLSKIDNKVFEGIIYFPYYSVNDNWRKAWELEFGTNAYCGCNETQGQLIVNAVQKGKKVVSVPNNFLPVLKAVGIKNVTEAFGNVDSYGRAIKPAGEKIVAKVKKIWDKLVDLNLTKGKKMPAVNIFTAMMEQESQLCGFYNTENKSINLESTNGLNSITILEELGHYITEAYDNTRDFQEFFIKLSTLLLRV